MDREKLMDLILDLNAEIRDLRMGQEEEDVVPQIKEIIKLIVKEFPKPRRNRK